MIADRDIYADASGRIVEAGSLEAAVLVARAGKPLPPGVTIPTRAAAKAVEPEREKSVKPRVSKTRKPSGK
jgi:hypothetical protein